MVKKIIVVCGPSIDKMDNGWEHPTIKAAWEHIKLLEKSSKTIHQAYRMVKITTNGDFEPSKETIYAERNPASRLEKRLSARGISRK